MLLTARSSKGSSIVFMYKFLVFFSPSPSPFFLDVKTNKKSDGFLRVKFVLSSLNEKKKKSLKIPFSFATKVNFLKKRRETLSIVNRILANISSSLVNK